MTVIDLLLGEHEILHSRFSHLESELCEASTLECIQRSARTLLTMLASHTEIEEGLLFQALEPHIGTAGPLLVMRYEHSQVRRALAAVVVAQNLEEAIERAHEALPAARDALAREERVLFDIARHSIPRTELEWLGQVWAASRGVEMQQDRTLTAR